MPWRVDRNFILNCFVFGDRDISFLYDVPKKEEKRGKSDEYDPTEVRKDEEDEEKPKKKVRGVKNMSGI